ncbi:MAG: anaerobic glycerol-3-phosphate dehydrogenase [Bradymonadia bacterium]|jgi:anaerobic glycerol-3-phosphate dehydrogenase
MEHGSAWAGPSTFLAATALQLAAKWHAADAHRIEALAEACSGQAIVPAVLGLTFARQTELRAKLTEAGADVTELSGAADSAFGVRLVRRLAAALTEAGVTTIRDDATLETGDDGWRFGDVFAKSVVLATGTQPRPGWAQGWYEPPARPPRNTSDSPWLSQPFLRDGIRIDGALRALSGDGRVFGAGGCLHGHDFVHDGTGFGVALTTGWLAGTQASEASA